MGAWRAVGMVPILFVSYVVYDMTSDGIVVGASF